MSGLKSRATELLSNHAEVMANKLPVRHVTFHPADVIQEKVEVVGSLRSVDGYLQLSHLDKVHFLLGGGVVALDL